MARSRKMTEAELATAVSGYIDDAKDYGQAAGVTDREKALKFFNGEVDFDPIGTSKVVSRDVSDLHDLIMPGLEGIFFSTDRIGIYEPTREHIVSEMVQGPDGAPLEVRRDVSEDRADQATDLINYIVLKEANGRREIRSAMSDGLVIGNGILKHWWDPSPVHDTDAYANLSREQAALILKDPAIVEMFDEEEVDDPEFAPPPPPPIEVVAAATAGDPQAMQAMAAFAEASIPPKLYTFKVKRLVENGRVRFCAMPNEEFLIDRAATVLDETTRFAAHRRRATRSELIEEGYSRRVVEGLPTFTTSVANVERNSRDRDTLAVEYSADKATEFVEVYECYVLVDFDGDGLAERRRVVIGGNAGKRVTLANEEWADDLPFTDLNPDPQAHAWRGRGLYEKIGDLMRIKTVLMRGAMDNTYQQLAPQQDVVQDSYVNMDEFYNPTPNGVRLLKNSSSPRAVPAERDYIVPSLMPMVEYLDSVLEKRTGVSARSQAMDMDALQNQSATAVNAAQSAAFAQVEDYAKNIADGLRRLFKCLYRIVVTHQDRKKTIRLRGKWVEVDPTSWATDMDVTVNTGLGTGSRERDLYALQALVAKQEQAMMALGGPANPVLGADKVMATYRKMAEATGLANPESYFPEIDREKMAEMSAPKQNAPDPAMVKAQAEIEAQRVKAEAELALKAQDQQAQQQLARQQAEFEMQLAREKAAMELQLTRDREEMRLQLRREEMMLEAELTAQSNVARAAMGKMPDTNLERPA